MHQSHNVALTRPIADFVVALGADGQIVSQGSLDKALKEDRELLEELATEEQELEKAEQELDKPIIEGADTGKNVDKTDGKLVVAEEIGEGWVGWNARESYLETSPGVRADLVNAHSPDVLQKHRTGRMDILDGLHFHAYRHSSSHQRAGVYAHHFEPAFRPAC